MPWKPLFMRLALATLSGLSLPIQADVTLSPLFSDGAILQRNQPIVIWGHAPPNSEISVTLGSQKTATRSDSNGQWQAKFKARGTDDPVSLTVRQGQTEKHVRDIRFGDLWLCGGQSNMEWPLIDSDGGIEESRAANSSLIRHFKIPHSWTAEPANSIAGGHWQTATDDQAKNFSAVGYYFAKTLHEKTQVPIGLLGVNWGGSNIESWMSAKALGTPLAQTSKLIRNLKTEFSRQNSEVKKQLSRWPGALVNKLTPGEADWSGFELAVGDWLPITVPGLWETQGLAAVDGTVWYRKEFQLSADEVRAPLRLGLAKIDDNDTTWVNGQRVGRTAGYAEDRLYTIPTKLLRKGKNVIAVRVDDTGGGGGIYGSAEELYIQFANGEKRLLEGTWRVKADRVILNNNSGMNHVPTALYNKMLHPLYRLPIKGVIWYQGESNANTLDQARRYRQQFQTLIHSWRAGWQQPNMPFYWVQLASYDSRRDSLKGSPWALVRDAQSAALALHNTGQVVTLDVGDKSDIHPRDKRTVGARLAAIALDQTYAIPTYHGGPKVVSAKVSKRQLTVHVNSNSGLSVRTSLPDAQQSAEQEAPVGGFEVVGDEGQVFAVWGHIEDDNRVTFDLTDIPFKVRSVRYGWQDFPAEANLQDQRGWPAEPAQVTIEMEH